MATPKFNKKYLEDVWAASQNFRPAPKPQSRRDYIADALLAFGTGMGVGSDFGENVGAGLSAVGQYGLQSREQRRAAEAAAEQQRYDDFFALAPLMKPEKPPEPGPLKPYVFKDDLTIGTEPFGRQDFPMDADPEPFTLRQKGDITFLDDNELRAYRDLVAPYHKPSEAQSAGDYSPYLNTVSGKVEYHNRDTFAQALLQNGQIYQPVYKPDSPKDGASSLKKVDPVEGMWDLARTWQAQGGLTPYQAGRFDTYMQKAEDFQRVERWDPTTLKTITEFIPLTDMATSLQQNYPGLMEYLASADRLPPIPGEEQEAEEDAIPDLTPTPAPAPINAAPATDEVLDIEGIGEILGQPVTAEPVLPEADEISGILGGSDGTPSVTVEPTPAEAAEQQGASLEQGGNLEQFRDPNTGKYIPKEQAEMFDATTGKYTGNSWLIGAAHAQEAVPRESVLGRAIQGVGNFFTGGNQTEQAAEPAEGEAAEQTVQSIIANRRRNAVTPAGFADEPGALGDVEIKAPQDAHNIVFQLMKNMGINQPNEDVERYTGGGRNRVISAKKEAISGDQALRHGQAVDGIRNILLGVHMMMPNGEYSPVTDRLSQVLPWSMAHEGRMAFELGLLQLMRADTGAAVTDTEFARYDDYYLPGTFKSHGSLMSRAQLVINKLVDQYNLTTPYQRIEPFNVAKYFNDFHNNRITTVESTDNTNTRGTIGRVDPRTAIPTPE